MEDVQNGTLHSTPSCAMNRRADELKPTAEYEFFQFRVPVDPNIPSAQRNCSSTARFLNENPVNSLPPLTEGMFGYSLTRPVHNQDYYYGIYEACEKFGCGIEGWHTESGPGVFEAVSTHQGRHWQELTSAYTQRWY